MTVPEYLQAIERAHRQGNATEHTYRPFFKGLLEARAQGTAEATNEPKRVKCGAPDYVVARRQDRLTLGYVEAKDVGVDLAAEEKSEQLRRYLRHLPNLLFTDYLNVRWYVRGERGVEKRGVAALGQIGQDGRIVVDAAEQARALQMIDAFLGQPPLPIHSATDLALRMAHLTHLVRDTLVEAFAHGEASQQLRDWREAFAQTLLPELAEHGDPEREDKARAEFADMFAQTLAYGLFSARAAGPVGRFTRDKARLLIPRTNPFLRTFFEQITGTALEDEPFAGFVDDLIQTLDHTGMTQILTDFGSHGRRRDPVVHFYETFLQAYDPKLRELRGVYYTPEPVVNYIVESLDTLLKHGFGLKDGLADRSKITVTRQEGGQPVHEESHRLLILDPATGTATFLYRVLDFIREQFDRKKYLGAWGDYVHEHLLPRLFGFELLMAPYAVAHFKIGLALAAWDKEPLFRQALSYQPHAGERINIFLTNTLEDLEETAPQLGPLRMLSDEANAAYEVKRHKPVLVILGNPPYSGHSANKGAWLKSLLTDYYSCDGKKLKEQNMKWLQDDYVKFVRWAQWRVQQTGQGIVGYVTNHNYLTAPTFRGMRRSLMQSFDEVYVLDLHGSTKPKENPPPGTANGSIFQIRKGVAILLLVKHPVSEDTKKGSEAVVRHAEIWGTTPQKDLWLDSHHSGNTPWKKLKPAPPYYKFVPEDEALAKEFYDRPLLTEVMPVSSLGILTKRDSLVVGFSIPEVEKRIKRFGAINKTSEQVAREFRLPLKDNDRWDLAEARKSIAPRLSQLDLRPVLYRPFDQRVVVYEPELVARMNQRILEQVRVDSPALIAGRQGAATGDEIWSVVFSTTVLCDQNVFSRGGGAVFPLYLYPNGKPPADDLFVRGEPDDEKRRPNFSAAFITDFCARLNVKFVREGLGQPGDREVGPELIFNYVYAVFHSPGYRERYAEFLRTDFPRLPVTANYELFRELARFGGNLVDLHARGEGEGEGITFPVKGDNVVEKIRYVPPQTGGEDRHAGRVWINDRQYFEGVAPAVWSFPIGGYRPAERWLKERLGRTLDYTGSTDYPRILAALAETRRLMDEIEASIAVHGGWPGAFA